MKYVLFFCTSVLVFALAPHAGSSQSPQAVKTGTASQTFASSLLSQTHTNSLGSRFALIPKGSFEMGSLASEAGRNDDEPKHEVTLTKAFYLGVYEVTQKEWRVVMGSDTWKKSAQYIEYQPQFQLPEGDSYPVVFVSFDDVQEFLLRLNQREGGKHYRLPSEAEWEYATRAGTTTARFWGEDARQACLYANVADLTAKSKFTDWQVHLCEDGFVTLAPVGQYRPNPYGLYDIIGNVWEWVQDVKSDYNTKPQTDPTGPAKGALRVVRGGSWYFDLPAYARSANRFSHNPDFRFANLGFRLARDP